MNFVKKVVLSLVVVSGLATGFTSAVVHADEQKADPQPTLDAGLHNKEGRGGKGLGKQIRLERRQIKRKLKKGKLTGEQAEQDLKVLEEIQAAKKVQMKENGGKLKPEQKAELESKLKANQEKIDAQVKENISKPEVPAVKK